MFFLRCMHISLAILENVTSSSCTDSAVPGRAKFHSNLLKNVRSRLRPVGAPLMFDKFTSLQLTLFILHYQRFSEVFFVDASTVETITADLRSIAVTKGIGTRRTIPSIGYPERRKEWLLLINNTDNTMLNLRDYFQRCSHWQYPHHERQLRNPPTCYGSTIPLQGFWYVGHRCKMSSAPCHRPRWRGACPQD
jgi:hypothetical protein